VRGRRGFGGRRAALLFGRTAAGRTVEQPDQRAAENARLCLGLIVVLVATRRATVLVLVLVFDGRVEEKQEQAASVLIGIFVGVLVAA
jgi:hypothetical protein